MPCSKLVQNWPYLTKYEDFVRLDALLMTKYPLSHKTASLSGACPAN